jgi:protein-disulfide isomerase
MGTPNFSGAPVRLTIFSDFQCPMCQRMGEIGQKLILKYKGKINIQYVFFPLDNACNPAIDRSLHPFACKAAYLAACSTNEFARIHDYICQNQEKLSTDFLEETAIKFNVEECYKKEASKARVKETIEISKKYNITSTPTNILNGRKIEGALPIETFEILIDELLK